MQRYTYMFKTLNALVLREVRYKDADRILTLLTDTEGKITAKARGALRKSSRTAAATQQLTWSEMTLFSNRGRWSVNEAAVKSIGDALEARELVKISVLDNSDEDPREAGEAIAAATGSEVVAVIGRKIILFRVSSKPEKRAVSTLL